MDKVLAFQARMFDIGGFDPESEDAVVYNNTDRTAPLRLRYPCRESFERLTQLKKVRDNEGVFPLFEL